MPLVNLYHNEIGRITQRGAAAGGMVAIRFVGGNHGREPSTQYACRDGYGAVVRVTAGEMTIHREHRCGEGFAAQNSATMIVGIGHAETIDSVTVRWPNGKSHTARGVAEGTQLTAYENPADSPSGSPLVARPYRRNIALREPSRGDEKPRVLALAADAAKRDKTESAGPLPLRMFTTMATWCPACKAHLPQQARLRAIFPEATLPMFGVPIDPADDAGRLAAYREQFRPAYRLLTELGESERANLDDVLRATVGSATLPATVVTNAEGTVVATYAGLPTVSDLAELMERVAQ